MKATPSSIDSLLQRVRQYRFNLDTSSDSEEEAMPFAVRRSHTLADHQSNTEQHSDLRHSSSSHSAKLSAHSNTNIHFHCNAQHRHKNEHTEPMTPKFSSSTISSSNVLKLHMETEQARNGSLHSEHRQNLPLPSSSSSNMSISSPSSIQQIFEKIQSFKAELNISSNEHKARLVTASTTPLHQTPSALLASTNNLKYDISSLHDTPSLLQPQRLQSTLSSSTDSDTDMKLNPLTMSPANQAFHLAVSSPLVPVANADKKKRTKANPPNLSIESQTIANVAPQFSHTKRTKATQSQPQPQPQTHTVPVSVAVPAANPAHSVSANQEQKTNQEDTMHAHSTSTRKSQKLDLKQFLSLPSPPKQTKPANSTTTTPTNQTNQQPLDERTMRHQISPFHEQYKSQMKAILNMSKTPSLSECANRVHSNLSETHYNYTSPSVISDEPLVPTQLLLHFAPPTHQQHAANTPVISLQDAYKRHRQSIDLKKKKLRKHRHKARKPQKSRPTQLNKRNLHQSPTKAAAKHKAANASTAESHRHHVHAQDPFCPCSCHESQQSATPMPPESSNQEEEEKKASVEEEEDAKQDTQVPVISSTIGTKQKRGSHLNRHSHATRKYAGKVKAKKSTPSHSSQAQSATHPISPPIARPIRRVKEAANANRVSDLDSDTILEQNQYTTSLCLSGKVINDLVRLSAISPSPVWYNNRRALHIKEIRNYSSEYSIISFVCCALWSKYDLEIVKLFKLSWSQRIMSFAEPSVMFYVIDMKEIANGNGGGDDEHGGADNVAKSLFNLAETRFGGLQRIELKYTLDGEQHRFSLMCIVDSYYVIDEHDRYFIDQSHCIPSYLIRNKNPLLV